MEPNRMKAMAGIVVIAACLASVFYIYSRPSRNGFGAEHDFVTVIAGSHCIVDRCDPYDSPTLEQEFMKMGGYTPATHFKAEWPVYPPSTLLLLLPLALLPWSAFSVIWLLACFSFLCAAFIALFLHTKAYRDILSCLPFVLLLADGSIGWAVQLGQPILIAASSLTLAVLALESASMTAAGALFLTLSLLLKPQAAILLGFYFLLKNRTRLPALTAYVITGAMAVAGTILLSAKLGSYAYLGHLASNLKLAVRPGGDADFSLFNRSDSASFLNLQAFLARFLSNPHLCNNLTYATFIVLAGLLIFVCWRSRALVTRPYTILAALTMLELIVTYHRLYDHVLMLAAIPGMYEMKERSRASYLLFLFGLLVYHFSQFHGFTIHGVGPFPSGAPVELFIIVLCLVSLWCEKPAPPAKA